MGIAGGAAGGDTAPWISWAAIREMSSGDGSWSVRMSGAADGISGLGAFIGDSLGRCLAVLVVVVVADLDVFEDAEGVVGEDGE